MAKLIAVFAVKTGLSLGLVRELRREVAQKLGLDPAIMPLDKFTIHGCGAVSRHDDKHNYPGVYFIIIVAPLRPPRHHRRNEARPPP